MRTAGAERSRRSRESPKRAHDTALCAIGCIAIWLGGVTSNSPLLHAAETVGGAEEVELSPGLVREIQFMLLRVGVDPGPIDGVIGPQTMGAFRKFQERAGFQIRDLMSGGRISATVLAKLRGDASRAISESEKKPETTPGTSAPASAVPPPPMAPPAEKPDRFAQCPFNPEDLRIGATQYTPEAYLQLGFDGSTGRAVSMLEERLNEARQIAENVGGAALMEVQRQSRVLSYFSCRLKVEQASNK